MSPMNPVAQLLFVIAGLMILGALGEYMFARTRVPDIVWLVAAGILAGPVFQIVQPELLKPGIPYFGAIALAVILSSGGFKLRMSEVASALPRGLLLGVTGFALSTIAIWFFLFLAWNAGFIHTYSPLGWLTVGAIVGGTSSAVISPSMALCRVPARVARMLEVESEATDALSVIIVMVLIDMFVSGTADLARPMVALVRELGIGLLGGASAAALLIPGIPAMRNKVHGYTVFLALMLALYAVVELLHGSGAIAVLTASLLLGNASTIVPRLFPGADGSTFVPSEMTGIMQNQITFLVKSFFFFLIGLMFPMDVRLIGLAAIAVVFLFASRILASLLATRGQHLSRKEFWFTSAAIPRGLAAGVLATLPQRHNIEGTDNLAPGIFAVVVLSNLAFAVAFWYISRWPDATAPPSPAPASEPTTI
jgi:cell volume regulation protein A